MSKWLKFDEISKGTKIRTALAVLAAINQALSMTDVPDFGSETANAWYKIISWAISAIVLAANTYYNNDYSKGATIGTAIGRQFNEDPTINVSVYDADEDDDDDEDGDVEIKEGDDNEVEQK